MRWTAAASGGRVLVDGRLDDPVGRVEVAMSKLIPHSGNVAPWDVGFRGEELRVDVLDRFADLDETDPNGVEDEAVVEAAPPQVGSDRFG